MNNSTNRNQPARVPRSAWDRIVACMRCLSNARLESRLQAKAEFGSAPVRLVAV